MCRCGRRSNLSETAFESSQRIAAHIFLVPGYGAQGGAAKDIAGAFDENGRGAVINSSRGIMCAYKKGGFDEKDYAVAARKEAIRMRDEINSVFL